MNPSTGQFLSKDSYEGDTTNPITLHKYLYAHGNPVTYEDPSGYFSITIGEALGALVIMSALILMTPNMPALKMD